MKTFSILLALASTSLAAACGSDSGSSTALPSASVGPSATTVPTPVGSSPIELPTTTVDAPGDADKTAPATQPSATHPPGTDSTGLTPEEDSPIGRRWADDTDAIAITELLYEADWWAGATVTHALSGGYETLEINVPRGSETVAGVAISRAVGEVAPAFAVTTRSVGASFQDLERIVAEVESAVSDSRSTLEPGSDSAEVLAIYRSEDGVSVGFSAADNSVVIASERASHVTTTVTSSGVVVEVGPVVSVDPG